MSLFFHSASTDPLDLAEQAFDGSMVSIYPADASDGSAAVIVVTCPAVREHQASIIGSLLAEAVRLHGGRLIVDVTAIKNFTSAWINELMSATRRCRATGGDLMVVGIDLPSERMLKATGLTKYLALCATRSEAITRLTSPARRAA